MLKGIGFMKVCDCVCVSVCLSVCAYKYRQTQRHSKNRYTMCRPTYIVYINTHWRRLVRNIGWANQNIWGKVVQSDKCMGVFQLLGACVRAVPQSLSL